MFRAAFITILTVLAGLLCAVGIFQLLPQQNNNPILSIINPRPSREIIGFLPYWLINYAPTDFSKYTTTLTYFGLRLDNNGFILRLTSPQEKEPGWYALESGKIDPFLKSARGNNLNLSLLIFGLGNEDIGELISDPVPHAKNLARDVTPLMRQYGFTDLNLDIEHTGQASSAASLNFTRFVRAVKKELPDNYTLTIEISPTDLIKKTLIDTKSLADTVDKIVIMGYDYHYSGSFVTGPVAPLTGAGTISEYDVEAAVQKALLILPPAKIILGTPLYGYEWETLGTTPRSAIIPGTGVVASNRRAEQLLKDCATCSAEFDTPAQESYLIYKDADTDTYHQIFFPDSRSLSAKINFAQKNALGGLALWALGYQGDNILNPLETYKNQ